MIQSQTTVKPLPSQVSGRKRIVHLFGILCIIIFVLFGGWIALIILKPPQTPPLIQAILRQERTTHLVASTDAVTSPTITAPAFPQPVNPTIRHGLEKDFDSWGQRLSRLRTATAAELGISPPQNLSYKSEENDNVARCIALCLLAADMDERLHKSFAGQEAPVAEWLEVASPLSDLLNREWLALVREEMSIFIRHEAWEKAAIFGERVGLVEEADWCWRKVGGRYGLSRVIGGRIDRLLEFGDFRVEIRDLLAPIPNDPTKDEFFSPGGFTLPTQPWNDLKKQSLSSYIKHP